MQQQIKNLLYFDKRKKKSKKTTFHITNFIKHFVLTTIV